ncbi:metal-dependent hydrolase [uncultured Tateyamaria sp.]|uniref:metal-dependent hydrolase n=1 Tax=uncultured Tateyamaria sp. TaxID=455651 RepID=UPI002631E164|nr:metal-dependent hydrolase [uncultured Tateyamaria sp.]
MIVGHLAAGYLAARAFAALGATAVFSGVIVGSVIPDVDILWFFLVDGQQTHHHDYLTHRPLVWAVVLLIGVTIRRSVVVGLGLGALLHLALDSIAGKVAWAWPVLDEATPLVIVPATQAHWVLSFLLHWTFAVEIALCIAALLLFASARRT